MSHTNSHHAHSSDPVEGDGVSYAGIRWFIVILTVTVLVAQLVVWGAYEWFDYRVSRSEAPRAVMAEPPSSPTIDAGRLVSGADASPQPALLVDEPSALGRFNHSQDELLRNYGWIDQGMGTVRLPIDRAKDLVLERGLPVRTDPARPAQP